MMTTSKPQPHHGFSKTTMCCFSHSDFKIDFGPSHRHSKHAIHFDLIMDKIHHILKNLRIKITILKM